MNENWSGAILDHMAYRVNGMKYDDIDMGVSYIAAAFISTLHHCRFMLYSLYSFCFSSLLFFSNVFYLTSVVR